MVRSAMLLSCALALAVAAPARASDLGSQSTGTVTISVIIPPFAAGLAAQAEGAVGLWTVSTESSALMLKLPDTLRSDGTNDAAIFTGGSNLVEVATDEPARVQILRTGARTENGLLRQSLSLRSTDLTRGEATPITLFIKSI